MSFTLQQIAKAIGAEWVGDGDYRVDRASAPEAAQPGDLALAMDKKYQGELERGRPETAVLWPGADWQGFGLKGAIFVDRPRFALAGITSEFDVAPVIAQGIHPSAVVSDSATIGVGASIGALAFIGDNVTIGKNARILPGASVAEDVKIGDDVLLYSGVRIGARVRIGDRFIAHFNAVVGGDGFSFVTPEPSGLEQVRSDIKTTETSDSQAYVRIASNASVIVGNDVEIGACATVDKGTIADTIVGSGTKMDNHVDVGHNVQIGENCLLCGHVCVAGSTVLGNQVVLGGQAGVADHLVLGDHVIAGAASSILSNVPKGRVVMGYPATKMQTNIDSYKALRRLPRLAAKVAALEAQVAKLANKG